MKISSAGKTDKGYVRTNNEDSLLVDDALGLYAIADGMGGHRAGEVASKVTHEALRDTLVREYKGGPATTVLQRGLQTAGIRLFARIEEDGELRGMGTTLTALLIPPDQESRATVVQVGDSRCYRWRGGAFNMLTDDHSWVWEQRKAGLLT